MISPKSICPHPGCNVLTEGGPCLQHKSNRGTSKNRPGDPFYSSKAWIHVRDARRAANPLCQECETEGKVTAMYAVDHILPRCDRPDLELEYDNTQSLCEHHHNSKTARARAYGVNAPI